MSSKADRAGSVWWEMLTRSWRLDPAMTATVAVLLVAQVGAFSATGLAMRAVVDRAADGGTGWGMLTAALVGGLAFGLVGIGAYVQFELRSDLADRIGYLHLDPQVQAITAELDGLEHLERTDYLDRLDLVRGKGQEIAAAGWAVPETIVLFIQLAVTLALLASVHPALLVLTPVTVAAVWLNRRSFRPIAESFVAGAENGRLEQHLHEITTQPAAGKEIRVCGIADALLHRADAAWQEVTSIQSAARLRAAVAAAASSVLFMAGYAGGLIFVVYLVTRGQRTIGDLVLVVVLAGRLRGDFQWAQHNFTGMLTGLALAKPYRWLVDYARMARPAGPPVQAPRRLRDGISLREVTFRYPGSTRDVLGPITVHLPARAMVAVVGEYGSGKTTLVKLLCKFYHPAGGVISVDGVDLDRLDTGSWRSAISAAYQDFARFETPARQAIGFGDLAAIDDPGRLRLAIRDADLEVVVAELPEGVDTQLGHRFAGVGLSEGQWQKVALARACMRREPALVLLDEPTASLDAPSEHAIFQRHAAIARRLGAEHGTVTLIVSHRFSTVRMADLILVLADGRLVEQGTHDELVAAGGRYAQLHEIARQAYAG